MPAVALPKGEHVVRELPEGEDIFDTAGRLIIEDVGASLGLAQQFIAGLDDVTGLLARPLEMVLPNVVFSREGVEVISPEETTRRGGQLGIPGRAREQPTGILGRAARFAGATAAASPVIGRAAGLVSRPVPRPTRLGRIGQFPKKQVAISGETFARAPITTITIETGLGASAGAGGFITGQLFPDSDAAVFVGDILGGVAPALTPTALLLKAGGGLKNVAQFVRRPFTTVGGKRRAAARAQRASKPEERLKAIEELDRPTTLDPETGEPVLTAAQRTGDPGMLSLERSIVETSEELLREADLQIAHANQVIQQSIRNIGDQPPISAVAPFEQKRQYLELLLDTRLRIAAQRVDERVGALGSTATREQANVIAREEIQGALTAARAQERELFAVIPVNSSTPFRQTKDAYEAFKAQLGKAQQGDIPAVARQLLDRKAKGFLGKTDELDVVVDVTTIKEMRSLQGKLRAVARNARAGEKKNLNKARIADELADSITEDIAHTTGPPGTATKVEDAVAFSRDLNDRFSRGTVAKILGRGPAGGATVPAGLTLESSIGVTGPRAREAVDDIMKAFDSPEAPGSQVIISATEEFTRMRFLKQAVEQGRLNVRSARRFVSQNEELLNRLPAVRRQLNEVIESGDLMAVAERQRNRVNLDDSRVSKATMLIEKGPQESFRQISRLKPADAARATQELVNRVNRDASGEALAGLKSGFIEFVLSSARGRARDVKGATFLSGFAMRDALAVEGTREAANRLFSPGELNRIGIITRDLIRLERRRAIDLAPEGVISDKPSRIIETVAGIAGAAVGRSQARRMGVGGTVQIPGIMANRFRDMVAAGVKDPASRFLRDAVMDEALFRELLQAPIEEEALRLSAAATARLNAWVAGVLAEHGANVQEDGQR